MINTYSLHFLSAAAGMHCFRRMFCGFFFAWGMLYFASTVNARQTDSTAWRTTLYADVFLEEDTATWRFGNQHLFLQIHKTTGTWQSLQATSVPGEIMTADKLYQTLDFKIDTLWMVQHYGATLLRHQVQVDPYRKYVSFELTFGVQAQPDKTDRYAYELRCRYLIFPGKAQLEREATVLRQESTQTAAIKKLYGFELKLPSLVLADAADCIIDVPGPFFPKTFLAPHTPLSALQGKSYRFHNAPDAGLGIIALSNTKLPATIISWMETAGEVTYVPSIQGNGKSMNLHFYNDRSYYLPANVAVTSDRQHLELTSSLENGLAAHRQMCEKIMPLDTDTPKEIKEMVLVEVYPAYFKEGFKGISKNLPFYREVGFNTIYLMPHWLGSYSPIDFYTVDPAYGTSKDLQDMVKTAHSLGMKVFFDMVIHGFNEKSPVIKQHPEMFVHDEQGRLARHPTWKSITTDWASPAYQAYMADLALHHVQTYGIDGYRLDAATYKGPSWETKLPYPAYRSGSAAPEVMEKMLQAMHTLKPEAVMLSEVFGPMFYTVSNLVHDNQTEGPQFLLEQMDKGEYTARDYKLHMQQVLSALPKGANRVYFARNHDTSWFYHFNGYTPRFMALEAIHALCAIPEVFAGDPKNKPNPDDEKWIYAHYQKLFTLRKEYPELATGELLLQEVEADKPMVFTALRRLDNMCSLITVSLTDKEETVRISISSSATGIRKLQGKIELIDGITGQPVYYQWKGNSLEFKLKPFQVLIGRW